MLDREASHTAMATAYLRAAHQLLDAPPRILDDPVAMAAFPSGSEVVLTFKPPPENNSHDAQEPLLDLAQRVASLGEPFVSFFTPGSIEEKLLHAGFTKVEFLSPAEADARYFQQRKDIPAPRNTRIACAIR